MTSTRLLLEPYNSLALNPGALLHTASSSVWVQTTALIQLGFDKQERERERDKRDLNV